MYSKKFEIVFYFNTQKGGHSSKSTELSLKRKEETAEISLSVYNSSVKMRWYYDAKTA